MDKKNVIIDIVAKDNTGIYINLDRLCSEILNTQQVVNEGTTVYVTNTGLLTDNSSETAISLIGAIEDNLSAGTAAWVDGNYIEGNGKDNDYYYNLGYLDGKADIPNASIEYEYHVHTGSNGSGCYTYRRTCGASILNDCEDPDGNGGYIFTGDNYYCTGSPSHGYGSSNPGSRCPAFLGWSLGCGKTESTIEKAIIVFE